MGFCPPQTVRRVADWAHTRVVQNKGCPISHIQELFSLQNLLSLAPHQAGAVLMLLIIPAGADGRAHCAPLAERGAAVVRLHAESRTLSFSPQPSN
jgi:hypothetical protein